LLPDANIINGGSGSNRVVTLYPVATQTGNSTVTLAVSDGSLTTNRTFQLNVTGPTGPNTPPTISPIPNQGASAGANVNVNFVVGDAEQSSLALVVSGTSSNQTLLPDANLIFSGSGSNRTLEAYLLAGQIGPTFVTLTVADGLATTNRTFLLTATNQPVTITSQPSPSTQIVNAGQTASIEVEAQGSSPLFYRWFFNGATPVGDASATLNLTNLSLANQGSYHVVISNSVNVVTSSVATLTVNTNIGVQIAWDRGGGNNQLANAVNWQPDGAPSASDIAVFKSPGVPNGYDLNVAAINWGALLVTANQTSFWNVNSTAPGGLATLSISGADIDEFPHAAIVNDSGQGGGVRGNLTLSGGGVFIIAHNSSSGLEFDGVVSETVPGTSIIMDGDGLAGTGQARVHIRGNNTASQVYQLTGSITVRNGANLRIEDGFDISPSGGALTVDATSKWNLNPAVTNVVAALIINGNSFAPGIYSAAAITSAGYGGNVEGSAGAIQVTGLLSPPALTQLPVSLTNGVGANALFNVTATGTTPLSFQWRFNESVLTNDARISGATSNVLSVASLALSDAGNYSVLVSNALGSTNSPAAVLAVTNPWPHVWSANLLTNPGVEAVLTPWTEYNGSKCDVERTTAASRTGASSARIFNRTDRWTGTQQKILGILTTNGPGMYAYSGWLRTESGSLTAYVTIRLVDAAGTRYFAAPGITIDTSGWAQSGVTNLLSWTNLTDAYLYVETSSTATNSFLADDLSLQVQTQVAPLSATGARFSNWAVSGGQFVFTITNGLPNGWFDLLETTNLALQVTAWATNNSFPLLFDSNGAATLTNPLVTSVRFFRVRE